MIFLSPHLLSALALIAVPIVIHLWQRRRAEVVAWGAMRFLLAGQAWRRRRTRLEEWLLLAARCGLVGLLALAAARPFLPGRRLLGRADGAQDVAIVIDGSLSMTLDGEGPSPFERAVDEARAVLAELAPADASALLLAGPTVQPVVADPSTDRQAVATALGRLEPVGGSLRPVEALAAAGEALARGQNPARRIVLITDGQAVGWPVDQPRRWAFLAEDLARLPAPPAVLVRTLERPASVRNLAVGPLRTGRSVIGPDRPVRLAVEVRNTGTEPLSAGGAWLSVDGRRVGLAELPGPLEPGQAAVLEWSHTFTRSGRTVLSARLTGGGDALVGDDEALAVIDVRPTLGVLVLDGRPSSRPLAAGSAFLEIALTRAERPGQALLRPTVVAAAESGSITDLSPYALVVLADVPRLPRAFAERLAEAVAAGTGLLIAPGERAEAEFYDAWRTPAGQRVMPAELAERVSAEADAPAARLLPASLAGGPLASLTSGYDLDRLRIRRHWRVALPQDGPSQPAALLGTGEAWLVLGEAGRGRTALLAGPLDDAWHNAPALSLYTPLAHELAAHLAGGAGGARTLRPGEPIVHELPDGAADGPVRVLTPDGRDLPAVVRHGSPARALFDATHAPGLYRLVAHAGEAGVPFVVQADEAESDLTALTDEALADLNGSISLQRAPSRAALLAALHGEAPGAQLWPWLVAAALALAVVEVALGRWVTARRRMDRVEGVAFGPAHAQAEPAGEDR